ncbi:YidB family protein [Chitinimonas taiwanensis]|uniref:YidB family protein n=1 Tax=Chitinimonas taiwanensis TaxID=240412 RepID=UPI0016133325
MSLFDQIGGLLGGNEQAGGALQAVSSLLEQQGGVAGLVQQFQQGGLSEVVSSWVGTGQNLNISPEQIQAVLGSGPVADIAAKLGISPAEAASTVSQWLPQIVDKLTPNGQLPAEGGDVLGQAASLLGGKLFG